jgi:4-nitrophenyl phosphatase
VNRSLQHAKEISHHHSKSHEPILKRIVIHHHYIFVFIKPMKFILTTVVIGALALLLPQTVSGFSLQPYFFKSMNRLDSLKSSTAGIIPVVASFQGANLIPVSKTTGTLPAEDSYDGIVCDMDGVLWLGNEEISQSMDALNVLKLSGKSVVFVTNNSAKTKLDIQNKLKGLGFEASLKDIITSSSVTAEYLKDTLMAKKKSAIPMKVFMIGNPALEEELTAVGFEVLKVNDDEPSEMHEDEFSEVSKSGIAVDAVVVGIDYGFNYRKLAMGSLYLGREALFVATNPDAANKVSSGALLPEPGALIAALELVSGKTATICGKPSGIIVDHVLALLKCDPTRVIMVGDRLDTDIAFANKAGVSSCLVLSGCTTIEEANNQIEHPTDFNKTPDFVANNLWDMVSPVASATLLNLIGESAPDEDPLI